MTEGARKPIDHEARRRARTDLDTSFCVEAGAGTGKTSLLVGRFIEILASGRARCGEIVAITFTEKAAGEMKIRIQRKIMELLAIPSSLEPATRDRLESAFLNLERSSISTIHSFAATLLREHPIEAGIDPNYAQLDALEGGLFIEECWNDFIGALGSDWSPVVRRFIALGGTVDRLGELVRSFYGRRAERAASGLFGGAPAAAGESGAEGASDLATEFEAAAERLCALAGLCTNPDDRGIRGIEGFLHMLEAARSLEDEDRENMLLLHSLPLKRGDRRSWNPSTACDEQKELFERLAGLQVASRTAALDRLARGLERLCGEFEGFVEARKGESSLLDFDDLLIRARRLLDDEATLAGLRERYRYILVDEFQDTDPLQAEIAFLLAGGEGGGSRAPAPGRLFIVGDPKQSIYRFRRADVEIYERVKSTVAAAGERLSIVQNFRSVPGIIDWVNGAFSRVMEPPADGRYQPAYEAIAPDRPGNGPAVVMLDVEAPGETSAGAMRRSTGVAITGVVKQLLERRMSIFDHTENRSRPIEHGDIAIIYPGTTDIEYLEDPLRAEAIPYVVEGGKLYYARQEIRDLAAALWAIEDPCDPLALVAALRSPLFGASDEEIFLCVHSGGRLDYLRPGAPAGGGFEPITTAFELLAQLHGSRSALGAAGTLAGLLASTKYEELSFLRPHGEQRVLNIRKAVDLAREFDAKGYPYRRFALWLREQERLAAEEGESPAVEERGDAVRLLTIHKAKGLQFPVVILANLVQQRKRRQAGFLIGRDGRIALRLDGPLATADYEAVAEAEARRDEAEIVRLLYVAATRAGDLLVIPATPKKGTYFEVIAPYLPGGGPNGGGAAMPDERDGIGAAVAIWRRSELPAVQTVSRPFARLEKPDGETCSAALRARSAWLAAHRDLLAKGAAAPAIVAPSRLRAWEGAVEGSERGDLAEDATVLAPADGTIRFGLAFHGIMEVVDIAGGGDIAALARSAALAEGIPAEGQALEELARRALRSEVLRRAALSGRIYREVPFCIPWEGHFVEGRIDLLFDDEDGWTVIDYKTDDVAGEALEERLDAYRSQESLYALALEHLGVPCRRIVLYFVRPDVVRVIEPTPELMAAAARAVRDATDRISTPAKGL